MSDSSRGPIEILCKEIGAYFHPEMETVDTLVSFVGSLVSEIERMIYMEKQISDLTGVKVSAETELAVDLVKGMLTITDREKIMAECSGLHRRVLFESDYGPVNRHIENLNSCVSAIRFGLERPCMSRHAADAADSVWKRKYGVTLFDSHSHGWSKQWARSKFTESMKPKPSDTNQPEQEG